eukprot:gene13390-19239_t
MRRYCLIFLLSAILLAAPEADAVVVVKKKKIVPNSFPESPANPAFTPPDVPPVTPPLPGAPAQPDSPLIPEMPTPPGTPLAPGAFFLNNFALDVASDVAAFTADVRRAIARAFLIPEGASPSRGVFVRSPPRAVTSEDINPDSPAEMAYLQATVVDFDTDYPIVLGSINVLSTWEAPIAVVRIGSSETSFATFKSFQAQ